MVDAGLAKRRLGGFTHTRGYKFDEAEAAKVEAEKLAQRSAYLGEEEIELTPAAAELLAKAKQEEDKREEEKKKVSTREEQTGGGTSTSGAGVPEPGKVAVQLPSGMHVYLPADLVTEDALKANNKDSITQQAIKQVVKDPNSSIRNQSEAARKAAEFAAKLHLKAAIAKAALTTAKDSHFTAELEINDYPQSARWKVTHKDALTAITEFTGCAVTARGQYCPPGRTPLPGDRKLYLFIEGSSVDHVTKAKAEIKRILDEATISSHPEKTHTRYSVV
eukprot:TRINITY_DN4896_c0_g2_i1.p1 TRINITY_DN4896_c0_g2~~TRINITY_DN4896_c0_g2_i1.p1  ORF type:complete len:277 (+),score=85.89 TRINITY_DN4896_c0_g2_i1:544-1374(+)